MQKAEIKKEKNPILELAQHVGTLSKLLQQFEASYRRGASPAELGRLIKKLEDGITKLQVPSKEALLEGLTVARQKLEQRLKEFSLNFGEWLQKRLTNAGLQAELKLPHIYIGLYTIKLDPNYSKAQIAFSMDHILATVKDPTPEEIVRALIKVKRAVEDRKFDPQGFAKRLYEAYIRAAKLLGKLEGDKIPIIDAMLQYTILAQPAGFHVNPVKENFQGYGWALFAYDLYRLNQARDQVNLGALKGKRWRLFGATQDLTTDKRKYIWVPTLVTADGRVKGEPYAYIAFE